MQYYKIFHSNVTHKNLITYISLNERIWPSVLNQIDWNGLFDLFFFFCDIFNASNQAECFKTFASGVSNSLNKVPIVF